MKILGHKHLACILGIMAGTAHAWDCQTPTWIDEPVVEDGIFIGKIQSQCKESLGRSIDLQVFAQNLVQAHIARATTVHKQPQTSSRDGAQTISFEVTADEMSDGDPMSVRSAMSVSTDQTSLRFANLSRAIEGEGNARYVQKIEEFFDFAPAQVSTFTFKSTIHIKKPGLVPSRLFLNQAKTRTVESFGRHVKEEIDFLDPLLD